MKAVASAMGSTAAWFRGFLLPPVCPRCACRSLPGGLLCESCRAEALAARSRPAVPPGLSGVACGPEIVPPVRELVHGLKYGALRKAAPELVSLAMDSIEDGFCLSGAVLVPVPLHPTRLRERGYNQSELAARAWSRRLGRPVAERWISRTRSTGTQTALDAAERRRNLGRAFAVGKAFRPGVAVILVDDVLTTGATLSSCAAVLLAAGCPTVRGLCLAWAGDA
jgi:ComF family protein